MAAPPRKRISASSSGALWPFDGLGRRAAFFFTVITLAAGCTVIFGVDDLVFSDQSTGGSTSGTGGDGGSTSGTGGDGGSTSGTGGDGGSTSGTGGSTGDVCLDCVYTSCGNELESCLNDADCFGIDCSCCYAAINDDSCMGYTELEGVDPTTGECTDDTASCGLYNALGACVCVDSCSSECSDMCG